MTLAGRWRASALEQIARVAESLGGGEVVGDQLAGRPLLSWTDFVTVTGEDKDTGGPGATRITKVERIGYAAVFSNGDRRALVRARVRIAR